jgi:hypothetical protein
MTDADLAEIEANPPRLPMDSIHLHHRRIRRKKGLTEAEGTFPISVSIVGRRWMARQVVTKEPLL